MPVTFFDTYKKDQVVFNPLKASKVAIYACGPTVYGRPHIGNMRKFIFDDVLRRTLTFLGYKVNLVMNITDVGHLSFDEDRLAKAAKQERKSSWEIAEFYTKTFLSEMEKLNIALPDKLPRATEHIADMIELITQLEDKGLTYNTDQAVYFDTTKFPRYEQLAGQKIEEKRVAAREEVVPDADKKNPADFALWFKTVGRFADHEMRWPSPWGEGFPGWHVECSAMSRKYLGQPFDIHTGGIDHVPIHHPNEIAQSEGAYGLPLANYWLHSEHVTIEEQKISKSLGNVLTTSDLADHGFNPLDFRYLVLTTHYQNRLNFTWEGQGAAAKAYANLKTAIQDYDKAKKPDKNYLDKFSQALSRNLDTPGALAILWELVRESDLPSGVKRATVNKMDEVLGLDLKNAKPLPLPDEVQNLVKKRDQARDQKDWTTSDQIRRELEERGFMVEDTPAGTKVRRKQLLKLDL